MGMYCAYCGKEMPENASFCPYCGKKNLANSQNANMNRNLNAGPIRQKLNKVFSFATFDSNDYVKNEINNWLSEQSIIISSISILSKINISRTRTVLSRCEIAYQEVPNTTKVYQMDYFARWRWIGTSTDSVDRNLDNWKAEHPECEVVYSTHAGHQYDGGNTLTLFFFYTTTR